VAARYSIDKCYKTVFIPINLIKIVRVKINIKKKDTSFNLVILNKCVYCLVGWLAVVVSLHTPALGDVIFAKLACTLNVVIFYILGVTNLSLYKNWQYCDVFVSLNFPE
jgi:hypothetical protein